MLTYLKDKQSLTSKTDDPLAKKWLEIEKKQKRNANFKRKITDLYQVFNDEILQEEHRLVELLGQETRHLMSFLPRKSFTLWQKEELTCWIQSNIDTLSVHPFGNAELVSDLRIEYNNFLMASTSQMDEDLELEHYINNLNRMFGKETMCHVVGSVTGETRFHGLFETIMKLEGIEPHLRLIESYKKLHQARKANKL